jgi:hypothetical protein
MLYFNRLTQQLQEPIIESIIIINDNSLSVMHYEGLVKDLKSDMYKAN